MFIRDGGWTLWDEGVAEDVVEDDSEDILFVVFCFKYAELYF